MKITLTPRLYEVYILMKKGYSRDEISEKMGIARLTIINYVNILKSYGLIKKTHVKVIRHTTYEIDESLKVTMHSKQGKHLIGRYLKG